MIKFVSIKTNIHLKAGLELTAITSCISNAPQDSGQHIIGIMNNTS